MDDETGGAAGDPMPEHLVALHQDTNANVAYFERGRLVFAAAEERFSRERFAGGVPERALRALLTHAGIEERDIGALVVGNRLHFLPQTPLVRFLPRGEYDSSARRTRRTSRSTSSRGAVRASPRWSSRGIAPCSGGAFRASSTSPITTPRTRARHT
ncbi:MAG TPA: hypothetical protein VIL20_04905 [Sandaracinaceae bacterium]